MALHVIVGKGPVGTTTAEVLAAEGHQVRVLSRSGCRSTDTTLKNSFGPTLCRALYYCRHCQQPFEQFKAL